MHVGRYCYFDYSCRAFSKRKRDFGLERSSVENYDREFEKNPSLKEISFDKNQFVIRSHSMKRGLIL